MFQAPLPPGTWKLRLLGALRREETPHDLEVTIETPDGIWPERIDARAPTYNSPDHPAFWQVASATSNSLRAHLRVEIRPDPWVAGCRFEGECALLPDGTGHCSGTRDLLPVQIPIEWSFRPESIQPPGPPIDSPPVWTEFLRDPRTARLPDFSHAGWSASSSPGPLKELRILDVRDFGAHPDSGNDARPALQAAIDAAAAAGGAIVFLPPGRFELSLDEKQPPLEIGASHVILRGSGSGRGGTELYCHRRSNSPDPSKPWRANEFPCLIHAGPSPAHRIGGYGPQPGAATYRILAGEARAAELLVEEGHGLRTGDLLLLQMLEDRLGTLGRWLTEPAGRLATNYLGEGRALVSTTVRILATDGDRIQLDTPLRVPIRPEWRPCLRRIDTLRGIGIERLRLRTAWARVFDHHRDAEHDNGWDHIRWDGVVDGWIRDVVHDSPSTAVSLMGCKNCVVMDGRITGNPGHNGYTVSGASADNLFLRLHGDRAMHAFGLQGTSAGTVFLDCEASEPAGLDLHGGPCLDTLYDGMLGAVQHGGGSTSNVPPRHARGLVFWNWEAGHYTPYTHWRAFPRIADWSETPGFLAVGVRGRFGQRLEYLRPDGRGDSDADGPWGGVEALGRAVLPHSLYRAQWERRCGPLPDWLR